MPSGSQCPPWPQDTLLAQGQFVIPQEPQVLLCRAAPQWVTPSLCWPLGFFLQGCRTLHLPLLNPLGFQAPLNGSTALRRVSQSPETSPGPLYPPQNRAGLEQVPIPDPSELCTQPGPPPSIFPHLPCPPAKMSQEAASKALLESVLVPNTARMGGGRLWGPVPNSLSCPTEVTAHKREPGRTSGPLRPSQGSLLSQKAKSQTGQG